MICEKCGCICDSMGYGDTKCPKCGKNYYSDFDKFEEEIEKELEDQN